ncbi:MAG: hypothetical protein WBA97_32510 [Actinophytocola sp.]|uniref:hypothetical protein n=1 Tax=Actinophytocola sp. TaxID=1872138 RepID=UPI003C785580
MLAVVCVLLVSGQPVAAQPGADVGSVVSRLEREQVVRLPGAVTSVDVGRLATWDRVVLAPAAGLPDDLEPLWAWASGQGVRLTVVEGWWIAQQGETVRVERESLPWVLASGDVTDIVLGVAAPIPQRLAAADALAGGLRADHFDIGVRLVTLPARPAPVTGYAAALADQHPDEMVVVASGAWLEFAGPGATRAATARDAIYGLMLLRRGSLLGSDAADLVTAVLDREASPPPRPLYAPTEWDKIQDTVYFWLALLIAVVGGWLLIRHRHAADVGPIRMAWAKAHLRVQLLTVQLAAASGPDMAHQHATTEGKPRTPGKVKTDRVRSGSRPVGKRSREKSRRESSRGHAAPEPTARPRGSASLRAGVYLACLIAFHICVFALTADPADEEKYTPQNAAHQLRYSSVYTYPLSNISSALDAEEAREIVGDRPLVAIAGFPTMCTEIAEELPDVIVVVVNPYPETPIVDCVHDGSFYDPAVLRDVRDTTNYLATGDDRTAYLAEYVRAFDTRHPSLRRNPTDNGDLTDDLITVIPLLVALGLAVFGAIALHRTWHTTNTRLNRLANLLASDSTPPTPHERVATATEYLHTLRGFETATTKEQRATTEQRLATLEQTITEQHNRAT